MGLDLFIGGCDWIGAGWGYRIVRKFIQTRVYPQYQYCVVDPDVDNIAAIRCYEKLRFKEHKVIDSMDALQRLTRLKLMVLKCTDLYYQLNSNNSI